MRRLTSEELKNIIENHKHWVNEDCEGWETMRANLSGADLSGADFYEANLSGADLSEANLSGAILSEASLSLANLREADLRGADLSGADLRESDLRESDLRGAENVPFIPMTCPDSGEFIGWKKCRDGRIVKLLIQSDAKRSSSTGIKCRCDKATVLEITDIDGDIRYDNAISIKDENFIYEVGKIVTVLDFDENRFIECARGIHFFINRQEAIDYSF